MLSCILYICTYFVFYKSLPTPLCPTVPLSERCLIVSKNPFVVNAYLDWCHHLSEENGLVCMFSDFDFVLLSGECPVPTLWRLTTFRGSRAGRYMYFRVLDIWDWKKARLWAVPDTVFLNTGYQVHFLTVTVNVPFTSVCVPVGFQTSKVQFSMMWENVMWVNGHEILEPA